MQSIIQKPIKIVLVGFQFDWRQLSNDGSRVECKKERNDNCATKMRSSFWQTAPNEVEHCFG